MCRSGGGSEGMVVFVWLVSGLGGSSPMRISIVTFAASFSLALACGGDEVSDGGFQPKPGCSSNAECADQPSATTCFEFGSEGPSTCGYLHVPVTECQVELPGDECCSNQDCDGARCFLVSRLAVQCSATSGGDGRNLCVVDDCESDADCPAGLCAPDGYGEGRTCVPAACKTDADCSQREGGVCAVLDLGCCDEVIGGAPTRTPEIACLYPGDGCQSDADCRGGEYCVVRAGRAVCSPSCP